LNSDDYIHAIKILKDKKKEFENEIKFVDDEINIIDKDYINRNAKFRIEDKVKFQNKIYRISDIEISQTTSFFMYGLLLVNNIHKKLYRIYEHNLELIEKNNND